MGNIISDLENVIKDTPPGRWFETNKKKAVLLLLVVTLFASFFSLEKIEIMTILFLMGFIYLFF